jgi:hypothetical protein
MVKKWFPKIIFFSLLGGLLVSSCLEPVDYGKLAKDERVKDYIERKSGLVIVDDQTTHREEKPLKEGSRIITNLQPEKYYMVEKEVHKEGHEVTGYPKYVTDTQGVTHGLHALSHITFVKEGDEGIIRGLTNGHTYTVRDAEPFDIVEKVTYEYTASAGVVLSGIEAGIENGNIALKGLKGENFTVSFTGIDTNKYEYVKIPIKSKRDEFKLDTFENSIEQPVGSVFDYVFVNKIDPEDFKVLRIDGAKLGDKDGIFTFKVNYDQKEILFEEEDEVVLKVSDIGYDYSKKITISVENVDEFDSIFKWYNNGEVITGENSSSYTFTITNKKEDVGKGFMQAGTHVLMVVATIEDAPYSKWFTLKILLEDT